MPEPVILVTDGGRLLAANRSFRRIVGVSEKDLEGGNLSDLTAGAPSKTEKLLRACSRSRQLTIGLLELTEEDGGTHEYRCEGALLDPAREDAPAVIFLRLRPKEEADLHFSLLTDKIDKLNIEIRERKRAEERSRRLYEKALEAGRLKDEFLATVSHELRTPLNSILGWTQILKTLDFENETYGKALETIERNTRVQVQLIDDILDVSRIITGKMNLDIRPTDLVPVIESSVDSVRPMAQNKHIELVTDLDPEAGPVSGDAKRIQQIVWNLLSNAIKFTPTGGRVRIALEGGGDHARIVVSDTGEGIPSDFIPYVFERFLQAETGQTRRHSGLGLGLAIVRHLAELHGGTVEVRSEGHDLGSVFTVSLPVFEGAADDRSGETSARSGDVLTGDIRTGDGNGIHPESLRDLRLLIVDDQPDARELLKVLLENYRARVETAASAAEAFEKFTRGRFNVLISDIAIPDEDGYVLIENIRRLPDELGGTVPAIALTAHARRQDRDRALSGGFDSYLAKPVETEELVGLVARLARRRSSG